MKSVLISIQPYWVFLIIAKTMGWEVEQHKSIEVRKNFPKDENWDKTAKIYCSKDKKSFNRIPKEYQPLMQKFLGKVVGRFICDRIDEVYQCNSGWVKENGCISRNEFFDYLGIPRETHFGYDKKAYAWHISNLKIYDKPKELSEFRTFCDGVGGKIGCNGCEYYNFENTESGSLETCCCDNLRPLTRPPQSYMFVESLGE